MEAFTKECDRAVALQWCESEVSSRLHLSQLQSASIPSVDWSAIFVIYFAAAAMLLIAWYAWTIRCNRNRAFEIVHWIENALNGQGHVTGIHWLSNAEFEVPLRLVSGVFRKARIMVRISPLELPLNWLMRRFKSAEPDTLTFFADLDLRPSFSLEMQSMRWFARSSKNLDLKDEGWSFESPAPVMLTTRLDWQKEATEVFQSVMNWETRDQISLSFQRSSPHFRATVPLEAIAPETRKQSQVFETLRAIAEGASARAS